MIFRKISVYVFVCVLCLFALYSCVISGPSQNSNGPVQKKRIFKIERMDNKISLSEDAKISIVSPTEGQLIKGGEVTLQLDLKGFELGADALSVPNVPISRSNKGQHIHVIFDDNSYREVLDVNDPLVFSNIAPGWHAIRAFLVTDWHESFKSENAFVYVQFFVDRKTELYYESKYPILTYNLPIGKYEEQEAENIVLDFLLNNGKFAEGEYTVQLKIDDDFEVILTESAPYLISGLTDEKHVFELNLIDPDKRLGPPPFNSSKKPIKVRVID